MDSDYIGNFHGIPTFQWQGHEWIKRPLWGTVHSNDTICYIDTSLPEVLSDGCLILPIKYNEKGVEGRYFGSSWVRTVEEFKYGSFEWEVILPRGEYVWPALWFESDMGWPPEIDALEGWSEESLDYIKRKFFKKIKPTVHWSSGADEKTGEHMRETKNNVWKWFIKSGYKVNKIKTVWTPNYVDIFYNGIKIKRFKNKEMLAHMNKPGYKFHPVMSVGFYGDKWKAAGEGIGKTPIYTRDFIIKSFKYTPIR